MRPRSVATVLTALVWMGGGFGLSVGLGGCKDYGSQPLPSGTVNPAFYHTPSGAFGFRAEALATLEQALLSYVPATGLLSDELQSTHIGASFGTSVNAGLTSQDAVDARILPDVGYGRGANEITDNAYTKLQTARVDLDQAQAAIAAYDTGAKAIGDPRVLRAELFALEGYTEILLADFFCSGVPLSTLDFQGDYTYHASLQTDQVYQDAIAKEDSALALADTSTRVQNLARVLKGRALLARNDVTTAAQMVAAVPDGFQYQLALNLHSPNSPIPNSNALNDVATVGDTEGQNGLPYLSSGDPRTTATVLFPPSPEIGFFVPQTFPAKYSPSGFSPFVVASGVEARLIQAEAALRAGDPSWLTSLNALRTTGNVASTYTRTCQNGITDVDGNLLQPGSPCPDSQTAAPGETWRDTTWSAGTGIGLIPAAVLADVGPVCPASPDPGTPCPDTVWYKGLRPLLDPGPGSPNPDSARVALLFHERAFWLFLAGERQGDLRRLLRQYGSVGFRSQDQVYPTGRYTGVGAQVYGNDVTAPIPGTEYFNPLYHGCLDRNP